MHAERQLPEPNGYLWRMLHGSNVRVLMPDQWFYNHWPNVGSPTYLLTEHPINQQDIQQGTFLSFQVYPKERGPGVESFIREMYESQKEMTHRITQPRTTIHDEQLIIHTWETEIDQTTLIDQTAHNWHTVINNTATGTLYNIRFETPMHCWEEHKPIATTMLQSIRLDPRF